MSDLEKRLDALEQKSEASKGKRIFVYLDDGRGIIENGEARTQADVDEAKKEGFEVVLFKVVHE